METFKKKKAGLQAREATKNILKSKKTTSFKPSNSENKNKRNSTRGQLLEKWRQEKGVTKKENCHPLLSRKRSLAQVVSSPSYKPAKFEKKEITSTYTVDRRKTFVVHKENQPFRNEQRRLTINYKLAEKENTLESAAKQKITQKEKRKTIHILPTSSAQQKINQKEKRKTIHILPTSCKPLTSPKGFPSASVSRRRSVAFVGSSDDTNLSKTPWKNESLSRRERLDLWLAAKGKTPYNKRRSAIHQYKSPHPKKRLATEQKTPHNFNTLREENYRLPSTNEINAESDLSTDRDLNNQLLALLEDNTMTPYERKQKLDDLHTNNKEIVHMADYWVCKARLAASVGDVQRVICLLEQAHAFQAKPEERIRDELCRFLQSLEDDDEKIEDIIDRSKYAITPGKRVHFAATDSPVEFKSSFIRFCIVESKAFKKRLNAELKKKVMTPVRRSARLRRSDIPQFLRDEANRIIDSPTQVEDDIIDGNIGFVPSKVLNTPLNKGWLIDDAEENIEEEGEKEDCVMKLSFM